MVKKRPATHIFTDINCSGRETGEEHWAGLRGKDRTRRGERGSSLGASTSQSDPIYYFSARWLHLSGLRCPLIETRINNIHLVRLAGNARGSMSNAWHFQGFILAFFFFFNFLLLLTWLGGVGGGNQSPICIHEFFGKERFKLDMGSITCRRRSRKYTCGDAGFDTSRKQNRRNETHCKRTPPQPPLSCSVLF